MVRLTRSTIIDAPVDEVWRTLRDFNGHAAWHPAIAASRIEAGDAADAVGAVRAFSLADGSFLREQLIALSDRDMRLTYCLLEAPIPLMGYVATMQLRPVTDGDRMLPPLGIPLRAAAGAGRNARPPRGRGYLRGRLRRP